MYRPEEFKNLQIGNPDFFNPKLESLIPKDSKTRSRIDFKCIPVAKPVANQFDVL